jgi:hypothetical protein
MALVALHLVVFSLVGATSSLLLEEPCWEEYTYIAASSSVIKQYNIATTQASEVAQVVVSNLYKNYNM